jgi:hypothetical protein
VSNDPAHASLTWGVKASLRSYLAQSGGELLVSEGATFTGDLVVFPAAPGRSDEFRGRVRFLAHAGLLDWSFADPRIDGGCELSLVGASGKRFVMAAFSDLATPKLTSDGSLFFEGMYPPGAELDPLEFQS